MGSHSSGDEVLSSLLRRSHISSTTYEHDRKFDARNSEDVHNDALAAALAEHQRIRQIAVRAIELSEAREATEKLRQHALQEEERVRIETERAQEECRLRDIENKARSIPKPAPRLPTPPPVQAPKPPPAPPPTQQPTPPPQPPPQPSQPSTTPKQPPPPNPFTQAQPPQNPFTQPQQPPQQPPQPPNPSLKPPTPPPVHQPAPPVQPPDSTPLNRTPSPNSHMLPATRRYEEIHRSLKQLRASVLEETKTNPALKAVTGDMRRRITAVVGQLTIGVGVNRGPVCCYTAGGPILANLVLDGIHQGKIERCF
jgi:nucleoporin GLE1